MLANSRRFEMQACLGRGGYGEVYLATMVSAGGLRQQVAVKTLRQDLTMSSEAVRRLRDEARLLAALNHHAILTVYDLVQLNDRVALITEYVDGQDLQGLIGAEGVPPPRATVEIIGAVAGALDAAFGTPGPTTGAPMRLVHRDVKPANIRVSQRGAVKLLDFGIAISPTVTREAHTNAGLITGTPGFLAPERFTEDTVQAPSDIYALGCVFYESLCGERLFEGVERRRLMGMAIGRDLHDEFIASRLGTLPGGLPKPVLELLDQMLAYDETDRPDAEEVEHRCDELASAMVGVNLRRWCRVRSWPPPTFTPGELDGRTIEETTLFVARSEPPPPRSGLTPISEDEAPDSTIILSSKSRTRSQPQAPPPAAHTYELDPARSTSFSSATDLPEERPPALPPPPPIPPPVAPELALSGSRPSARPTPAPPVTPSGARATPLPPTGAQPQIAHPVAPPVAPPVSGSEPPGPPPSGSHQAGPQPSGSQAAAPAPTGPQPTEDQPATDLRVEPSFGGGPLPLRDEHRDDLAPPLESDDLGGYDDLDDEPPPKRRAALLVGVAAAVATALLGAFLLSTNETPPPVAPDPAVAAPTQPEAAIVAPTEDDGAPEDHGADAAADAATDATPPDDADDAPPPVTPTSAPEAPATAAPTTTAAGEDDEDDSPPPRLGPSTTTAPTAATTAASSAAKPQEEAPPEETGVTKLTLDCSAKDARACFALGDAWYYGREVNQDLRQAALHYGKACDLGDSKGCLNAGDMYEKGEGVGADEDKAYFLFKRGCDAGDSQACYRQSFLEIEQ